MLVSVTVTGDSTTRSVVTIDATQPSAAVKIHEAIAVENRAEARRLLLVVEVMHMQRVVVGVPQVH